METFYLIIIVVLFLLAISDLIVGVSNDAVNFLNSAVGSKAATFKLILFVAALGILLGCTFSSGMMEVARKGIFHPEYFYFSEIMLIFLAVMVTDVILLDAFNTFGMPTSTTVSVVFELLGAAVALSLIKVYTDPNALDLGEYINSGKALAIISGILFSVVISFSAGVIIQYLTRLLFSFNYEKRLRYLGSIWGGLAIASITYFLLVKGSQGASFMDAKTLAAITENTWLIIGVSFVGWTIVLQLLIWFTKVNILTLIVLIGTFSLSMAFAGNDLVNFIGVPLAGYNSYEIWTQTGGAPDSLLMDGLAGKVPTPTILLLLAGVIMAITLWTSKKAKSVVKTSLDLGRQHEGNERFSSYAVSRSLVRNFGKMATVVNDFLPAKMKKAVENQFDERPFIAKQAHLGAEAPSFDLLRAAVTLVVASILITMGTNLKLPLSTTYVTFMVFMGTSLADGAWGRESAVYRVSGVLSVIGGWFFTALSAFVVAFIFANIFYFGGSIAIVLVLIMAAVIIYRSHKYHGKRMEEELVLEKGIEEGTLTREKIIELSVDNMTQILGGVSKVLDDALEALEKENLANLNKTYQEFKEIERLSEKIKRRANKAIDKIEDDQIEMIHLHILVADYLNEMTIHVRNIVKPSLDHVDNNHKTLIPVQMNELRTIQEKLKERLDATIKMFDSLDADAAKHLQGSLNSYVKLIRTARKNQIKRIKNHEIGTRNSVLFLNFLGEYRNLALFSNRMVKVMDDLIFNPEEEKDA
ncbi:MAG: inorganic phosphate transporter [Saprospirales bacterium]|nr:inorganic phosphate transporter [Saprospirales bacterium]